MKSYAFSDREAIAILKKGGLIAFPTETVFGIGCRFDDQKAFQRLVQVKRRAASKPFTLMLALPETIGEYAFVDERQQRIIAAFLPGELTIVLKKKATIPAYVALNGETIGIRVPAHEKLALLLKNVGVPLLVPSANKAGEPPCVSAAQVQAVFGEELDGVIDDKVGDSFPSTVVLLTGEKPVILRPGKITAKEIDDVWN